jgi:zinc protease
MRPRLAALTGVLSKVKVEVEGEARGHGGKAQRHGGTEARREGRDRDAGPRSSVFIRGRSWFSLCGLGGFGVRALLVVLAGLLASPAIAQPLTEDPRLVRGELDNGLGYIVRRHDRPPGRAFIWLHVSSGSMNETEKQRGIAHFLEHMAFNGSEHFPPGSVVPFFESLGLTFGQHQNAFTGFDQTTYQLAVPDTKPETIEKAMQFMSDVATRLSLLPEEIDKERQVILEERRTRLSGRQRVNDRWIENLSPGSLLGRRIPIGTVESLTGLTPEDFKDYYKAWYVPSNMTVIAVADMDPAPLVESIRTHFAGGQKQPRPTDQDPGVTPYEAPRAIIASDEELTDAQLSILWLTPSEEPTTTVELYRRDLIRGMGMWSFNRRLSQKINEGKLSMLGGGASSGDLFRAGTLSQLSARGEPGKWNQMLTELATELQRARLHGFTEQEIADARAAILASAEQAVEQDATRPSQGIMAEINSAIAAGVTITSAQEDLRIAREVLPTIKPADVSAWFAATFDPARPPAFSLQTSAGAEVPTEARLVELGMDALKATPEADQAAARASALLERVPEPAALNDLAEDEASHIWSGWLENNARLHYRSMDYRKDVVMVAVTVAGGEIGESAENRGITQAGMRAWSTPATSTLTSTQIRDLMTGKKAQVGGGAGADALLLQIGGSPADLEHAMQLAHLMLTDPVVEQAAFDQWVTAQKQSIAQRPLSPQGVLVELMAETLYPAGEARTRPLTAEQVDRLTAKDGQAWLRRILATGPIEIAIVGDIEREKALDLARRYLGTLPSRPRISKNTLADRRGIQPNPGPLTAHRDVASRTDQSVVLSGFMGVKGENLDEVRLMNVASRILTTRANEQIRERRQLAYSPGVTSAPGVEYPALGIVALVSPTAPDKVQALREATDQMFRDFAADGPTQEEMDTVRKQIANALDEQMRNPQYWADLLRTLDYRGKTIADALAAPAAYQAITARQVRDLFARCFTPERRFEISVSPAAPQGETPASPE